MKVTLINHSDSLGGASVVTFRLMEALRAAGIDAQMLVSHSTTGSPHVTVAATSIRRRIPFVKEHLRILTHNGMSRTDLFKVSIATDGLPLSQHPLVHEADVVILNWINQGMLSLDEIGRIATSKPLVWVMHDMWNVTSLCHHAGECDKFTTHCHNCPLLNGASGPHDLSYRTFDRKKELYGKADITFVAVSSWLEEKARISGLTRNLHVEMIPNTFDASLFTSSPTYSREQLGLPKGKKIILFCAARIDDPVKNLPLAIDALNLLADSRSYDIHAVFVGNLRDSEALGRLRLPHTHTALISDSERMRSFMAHADVVLSTSHYESFGATLLEGQASGAVPVGLVHDGRADIIADGISGYAASDNADSVAQAIDRALSRPIPPERLRHAASRFDYRNIAARYIVLLEKLSNR